MNEEAKKTYFINIKIQDGVAVAHALSMTPPPPDYKIPPDKKQVIESGPVNTDEQSFKTTIMNFVSVMDSYLKFIRLTLAITPQLSASIARDRMQWFTTHKGEFREDLSHDDLQVYELDVRTFPEFCRHHEEISSAITGAKQIPGVMIIGLISAYDAYLGQLIRVAHTRSPNASLVENKEIKFADLRKYKSIEDARIDLIDKDVDAVMRKSHQDQMTYIEKQFGLTDLQTSISVWPSFIEVCERRNLLTHTAGVVSAQYINICKEQKYSLPESIQIGQNLGVNPEYFNNSIGIVYEMGVRVGYALWRKCVEKERSSANDVYNNICYNLIRSHQHRVAENLLKFAVEHLKRYENKEAGCVQARHMMVVNYANAVKLESNSRKAEVTRIIESIDWSTSNDMFVACVAAVQDDIDKLIDIMKSIGSGSGYNSKIRTLINADDYRTWPVFRSARKDMRFISAFEDIFGEPFVTGRTIDDTSTYSNSVKQLDDVHTDQLDPSSESTSGNT